MKVTLYCNYCMRLSETGSCKAHPMEISRPLNNQLPHCSKTELLVKQMSITELFFASVAIS